MHEWFLEEDSLYVRETRPEVKKNPIVAEVHPAARLHNYQKIVKCREMFNALLESLRAVRTAAVTVESLDSFHDFLNGLEETIRAGLESGGYNEAMFKKWSTDWD